MKHSQAIFSRAFVLGVQVDGSVGRCWLRLPSGGLEAYFVTGLC
jgi:hypothetical protein